MSAAHGIELIVWSVFVLSILLLVLDNRRPK